MWSLRADRFQITSLKELVEAIIYPPNELELGDDLKEKFILLGALIVDQLWKCCNLIRFEGSQIDAEKILRNIWALEAEHWNSSGGNVSLLRSLKTAVHWQSKSQRLVLQKLIAMLRWVLNFLL